MRKIEFTDAELSNLATYLMGNADRLEEVGCEEADCPTANAIKKIFSAHEIAKAEIPCA